MVRTREPLSVCNRYALVVVDECESLALSGHLVLGEEDAGDVAEGAEQVLQVVVLHVLAKVRHADRSSVLVPPPANNMLRNIINK